MTDKLVMTKSYADWGQDEDDNDAFEEDQEFNKDDLQAAASEAMEVLGVKHATNTFKFELFGNQIGWVHVNESGCDGRSNGHCRCGDRSRMVYFSSNQIASRIFDLFPNDVKIVRPFKNYGFVITGKLSKPRSYYEKLIKKKGGTINKSVTKSTTHLLTNDVNAETTKLKKAKSHGIIIVDAKFVEQ